MDKDEFLRQFQDLNTNLEGALASQILTARCELIRCGETCSMNLLRRQCLMVIERFETLEHCAAENAKAITQLSSEMTAFQRQARKNLRGLVAIGPEFACVYKGEASKGITWSRHWTPQPAPAFQSSAFSSFRST